MSLAVSRETHDAFGGGLGDAVILIPQKLVDELTKKNSTKSCCTNSAHIRRYDDWTNLWQKLAEAIFFFHPAVRWNRRASQLRARSCL